MPRKLQCDTCHYTWTDEGSIKMAQDYSESWRELCRKDGIEPRGLSPCPFINCPGELVLVEEE